MTTFVDTSALFAYLDENDRHHGSAVMRYRELAAGRELVTHNYVVVETAMLVNRRLGHRAARVLLEDTLRPVGVGWIDRVVHTAAVATFLAVSRRGVSLVDRVSFEFMRRSGIRRAFAFDGHFRSEGFELVR